MENIIKVRCEWPHGEKIYKRKELKGNRKKEKIVESMGHKALLNSTLKVKG